MDMRRRKFTFETLPIQVKDRPNGGSETRMVPLLGGRIVDAYSEMPVGMVPHVATGDGGAKFKAITFFPVERGGDDELPEPKGGWGRRFDLAAIAVWKFYNRQLPPTARFVRFCWRWIDAFWFVAGIVLSTAVGGLFDVLYTQP